MSIAEFRENGVRLRVARAMIRRDLQHRQRAIPDVISDPPECLHDVLLFDVLLMAPGIGPARLAKLNEAAIQHGVNLAKTAGGASASDRRWLAVKLAARAL